MTPKIIPESIYDEWIARHVQSDPTGLCREICERMIDEFPELALVRGHCHITVGDVREWPHWWLQTADGTIVDPTRKQFPGPVEYQAWKEGFPEPTGKCANCGGYCYKGKNPCCSDECHRAYAAYCMTC